MIKSNDSQQNKGKGVSRKGGSESQFPGKLHDLLTYAENRGFDSVIGWNADGDAFFVHDPEKLVRLLPLFFGQSLFRSFQRQLNMWHFRRISDGPYRGAFVHPYFVRGNKALCARMSRHNPPDATIIKDGHSNSDISPNRVPLSSCEETRIRIFPNQLLPLFSPQLDGNLPVSASSAPEAQMRNETWSKGMMLKGLEEDMFKVDELEEDVFKVEGLEDDLFSMDPNNLLDSTFYDAVCPGISVPASPETVENIFDELSKT